MVCPGLIVPPKDEDISSESMWNEMRDIFTEDVLEKVSVITSLEEWGHLMKLRMRLYF